MAAGHAWAPTALAAIILVLGPQALAVRLPGAVLLALIGLLGVFAFLLRLVSAGRGIAQLKQLMLSTLFGLLGLLSGLAWDLGPASLLLFAAWCSARTELGMDELWSSIRMTPWGHIGMLLGCNLGMLLSGCSDAPAVRRGMPFWLFLLFCNMGMLIGMLALGFWPFAPSGGLREIALLMVARMLLAMAAGMVAVWWIVGRLYPLQGLGVTTLREGRSG
jgi:hypothetical protein